MKKLSALAQLVALYRDTKNITSTTELATLTGYTDRAIRKAKSELDTRNQGSAHKVGTRVPPTRNQGSAKKARPSRARIDSPFGGDSYLSCRKKDSRLESDARLSPTTTAAASMRASKFPENPTESDFIHAGTHRLSLVAIDNCAIDAGLPKEKARRYAETILHDWVARADLPKFPMTVMRIKLDALARDLRSRKRTDAELEHGTGRG